MLNNMCGMLVASVIVKVLSESVGTHGRLVFAACTLGNVGQIPLALASAACTDGLEKFADREGECHVDSEAMVGFGISVGSIAVWTIGQHLLRPVVEAPAQSQASEPSLVGRQDKVSAYRELDERTSGSERASKGGAAESEGEAGTETDIGAVDEENADGEDAQDGSHGERSKQALGGISPAAERRPVVPFHEKPATGVKHKVPLLIPSPPLLLLIGRIRGLIRSRVARSLCLGASIQKRNQCHPKGTTAAQSYLSSSHSPLTFFAFSPRPDLPSPRPPSPSPCLGSLSLPSCKRGANSCTASSVHQSWPLSGACSWAVRLSRPCFTATARR